MDACWRNVFSVTKCLQMLCLPTILGHILRLPCEKYGSFSVIKTDFALIGHVLNTFNDLSVKECEYECLQHPLCRSINTKNTAGSNCNLNSKSTEYKFDDINVSPSLGWTYRTTNSSEQNIGKICQAMKPCSDGMTCIDTCECPGFHCQQVVVGTSNCQDIYKRNARENKIYSIYRPEIGYFDVSCDMSTIGGGWIVFQRRVDASIDFNRGWNEYKSGFGDLNGNFWIGLEKLHKLTSFGKRTILRVDIKHKDFAERKFAEYSLFEIAGESDGYRLKIGGYSGDATDSLTAHNNMKFTTQDKDQDLWYRNCAVRFNGGWWYTKCHPSNLNSLYPPDSQEKPEYVSWPTLKKKFGRITFSEMKLKYS